MKGSFTSLMRKSFRAIAAVMFLTLVGNVWATAPDFSWLNYSEVVTQTDNVVFKGDGFVEAGWIGFNGPVKKGAKCLVGPGFAVYRLADVNEDFVGGVLVRDANLSRRGEYEKLSEYKKKQVCPPTTHKQNIYIEIPMSSISKANTIWRMVK